MKAICYVFSGTGNTLKACKELSRRAEEYGVETDVCSIVKGGEVPDPEGYDAVLIGYPVHAFNAPAPVLKFLKKLKKRGKKAERKPAYLVRTSGEPLLLNRASGILPARILRRRGYEVRGEFAYVMPYNIIFRHSDKMAARMWQDLKLLAERDAKLLAAGGEQHYKVGGMRRLVSFVLRVEHPAMPVIGKTFHVKKNLCVGCGLCAKVCPQQNITFKNGKPKFGFSCAGCMGCAFSCPKDAIRTSLLNGWRVNGAYPLEGEAATDEEVCNYCNKAYLRYFHEAEGN